MRRCVTRGTNRPSLGCFEPLPLDSISSGCNIVLTMWLLNIFSILSRIIGPIFYRLRISGESVPRNGPVLLVANHPNSLFDPVLVMAAARRKVRFLGKAPLFSDPLVGWLVRGSGSIPVYRRQDDPALTAKNEDMFRAVHDVISEGAAVAIFPEGISHNEPSLTPLKTGAARIALGAAAKLGGSFPIIPVGLVFRQKERFRSEAQAVVGEPVEWEDLSSKTVGDVEAVRELTRRIDESLRTVTVNLEDWEDKPVVECALSIWETANDKAPDPAASVARLKITTQILRAVREAEEPKYESLIRDIREHGKRLERFGLTPRDLRRDTKATAAISWSARRLFLLSMPSALMAAIGFIFFWLPYRLTGIVASRMAKLPDQVSIHKLLLGIVFYGTWLIGVSIGAAVLFNFVAALTVLLALPLVAIIGRRIRERWRGAWDDARSFMLLRSRREFVDKMRDAQAGLEKRLDEVYMRHAG